MYLCVYKLSLSEGEIVILVSKDGWNERLRILSSIEVC